MPDAGHSQVKLAIRQYAIPTFNSMRARLPSQLIVSGLSHGRSDLQQHAAGRKRMTTSGRTYPHEPRMCGGPEQAGIDNLILIPVIWQRVF